MCWLSNSSQAAWQAWAEEQDAKRAAEQRRLSVAFLDCGHTMLIRELGVIYPTRIPRVRRRADRPKPKS